MTAEKADRPTRNLDAKVLEDKKYITIVFQDEERLPCKILKVDQQRLYVETEDATLLVPKKTVHYYILKHELQGESTAEKKEEKAEDVDTGTININTASEKELLSLPGIGQMTAEEIVSYIENYGWFTKKEELMKVKGISRKRFDAMKELISV